MQKSNEKQRKFIQRLHIEEEIALFVSSHPMFSRFLIALVSVIFVIYHGLKKGSLNRSGAVLAFFTGLITCCCGYRFAICLISFYLSSSFWTKYKSKEKAKLEDGHKDGGERNWIQVISNSGTATVCALFYYRLQGEREIAFDFSHFYKESFLMAVILGHYACCNGDTWASEIGILSQSKPLLISRFRRVAPGTNGAISALGTFASVAGGTFIGFVFWIAGFFFNSNDARYETPAQWYLVLLGAFGGLVGSLIDSLLGATLQYSGWCSVRGKVVNRPSKSTTHISGIDLLDNHMVNFLSSLITGLLVAYAAQYALLY